MKSRCRAVVALPVRVGACVGHVTRASGGDPENQDGGGGTRRDVVRESAGWRRTRRFSARTCWRTSARCRHRSPGLRGRCTVSGSGTGTLDPRLRWIRTPHNDDSTTHDTRPQL